jgi:hypothetical protein
MILRLWNLPPDSSLTNHTKIPNDPIIDIFYNQLNPKLSIAKAFIFIALL